MKPLHTLPVLLLVFSLVTPRTGHSQLVEEPFVFSYSYEVSGGFGFALLFPESSENSAVSSGYFIEAGYRPDSFSNRALVGVYGFNLPGQDRFRPQPTFRGFGVKAGYQLLGGQSMLSPCFSLGGGWFQVDVPPPPTFDGSVVVTSEYVQFETVSIAPGAGFYVNLTTELALKADATLHFPLGEATSGKSGNLRLIPSFSVAYRFGR